LNVHILRNILFTATVLMWLIGLCFPNNLGVFICFLLGGLLFWGVAIFATLHYWVCPHCNGGLPIRETINNITYCPHCGKKL
jgi:hypothetical protein